MPYLITHRLITGGTKKCFSVAFCLPVLHTTKLFHCLSLVRPPLPPPPPTPTPRCFNPQAFVTLGGIATSALAALREVVSTDAAADWTGLVAGFAAGMWLGWNVSPVYRVHLIEEDTRRFRDSATSSSSSSSALASYDAGDGSSTWLLLPVLRDTRPAKDRANAVLGYAGVLFAVLAGWLIQQGGL